MKIRLKNPLPRIILGATLLIVGTSSFAATDREKAQQFYESAVGLYRIEDFSAAMIQLRNALQQNPEDLPARILLGRILLRLDHVAAAITEFEKALSIGGDENLILPSLGKAYLEYLQPEKVLTGIVPEGHEPEVEGELWILHGTAHAMMGHRKQADEAFLKATVLLPTDPRPFLEMARGALAKGQRQRADSLIDQAIGLAPDDFDVWIYKAIIHRDFREYSAAIEAFERALQIRPTSGRALTARAAMWLDIGQNQKAQDDLQKAFDLQVDTIETVYLQTLIYFREGKNDEAKQLLRSSTDTIRSITEEAREKLPHTTLLLGISSYFDENYSEAVDHLTLFLSRSPNHVGAKRYLAATYLALQEWDSLIKLLKPSPRAQPPNDANSLSMLAEAYRAKGNYKLAERYYGAAIQLAPNAAGLGIRLAMSRIEAGKTDLALRDLTWLTENFPSLVQAKIQLAHLYIKTGRLDEAEAYIAGLVAQFGDDIGIRTLAGGLYSQLGDFERAREHTRIAASLAPDAVLPHLNLARISRHQGNFVIAETKYREILVRHPNNERAVVELADLLLAQNELTEAKERVEQLVVANPNSYAAVEMLIKIKIREQADEEELRNAAYEIQQKFPEEAKAELLAGQVFMHVGDREEAKRLFRSSTEKARFDTEMLVKTARSQLTLKDLSGALWSLTKAVQGSPKNLDAATLRITVMIDAGDLEQSDEILTQLESEFAHDPKVMSARGHWLMSSGDMDAGIELFEEVYQRTQGREAALTLFKAYQAVARGDDGIKLLTRWVDEHPEDISSRHKLAQALIVSADYIGAKDIYEKLQLEGAEDIVLLNNLAALYQRLGDKRAVAVGKRAYELAPEVPSVLDTYGWILVENGEIERGLALLREAFARYSSGPEIRYHIGLALAKLGKQADAIEELEASLESEVWFADAENAKSLLKQIRATSAN